MGGGGAEGLPAGERAGEVVPSQASRLLWEQFPRSSAAEGRTIHSFIRSFIHSLTNQLMETGGAARAARHTRTNISPSVFVLLGVDAGV